MTDFQLPRNLWHIDMLAFEREGGVARGDPKRRDFGEVGDAVREVLLLRIATHVGERQNANRQAARRSRIAAFTVDMLRRAHGEGTNRALDVFRGVLAQVLELALELLRHLVAHDERNCDAATGASACSRAATMAPSP